MCVEEDNKKKKVNNIFLDCEYAIEKINRQGNKVREAGVGVYSVFLKL